MAIVLAALALIIALAALALSAQRFLRDRQADRPAKVDAGEQPADRPRASPAKLEGAVRQLATNQKKLAELSQSSVRNIGVVRFDAFEDMGGRLSFSAAFLDGKGDGVVITSINGRQDTRCYAKQVENWTSIHNLSDEERQAIREAMSGAGQRAPAQAR